MNKTDIKILVAKILILGPMFVLLIMKCIPWLFSLGPTDAEMEAEMKIMQKKHDAEVERILRERLAEEGLE